MDCSARTQAIADAEQTGAGTDYTAQNAVTYLSGFGAMGVSGVIADAIGYRRAFGVSVAIAFLALF